MRLDAGRPCFAVISRNPGQVNESLLQDGYTKIRILLVVSEATLQKPLMVLTAEYVLKGYSCRSGVALHTSNSALVSTTVE